MKIAVTSQNFRTVTGHAGKSRRFFIYEAKEGADPVELKRLDLPKELSFHEFHSDEPHPIDEVDVVVTGGCGPGFPLRMAARGIRVVATAEIDPFVAAKAVAQGLPLPPALPHEHGGC